MWKTAILSNHSYKHTHGVLPKHNQFNCQPVSSIALKKIFIHSNILFLWHIVWIYSIFPAVFFFLSTKWNEPMWCWRLLYRTRCQSSFTIKRFCPFQPSCSHFHRRSATFDIISNCMSEQQLNKRSFSVRQMLFEIWSLVK